MNGVAGDHAGHNLEGNEVAQKVLSQIQLPHLVAGTGSEPPAMVLYPFSAVFVVDSDWNGEGTITYGGKTLSRVPIRAEVPEEQERRAVKASWLARFRLTETSRAGSHLTHAPR
jgi:hypothetical protein